MKHTASPAAASFALAAFALTALAPRPANAADPLAAEPATAEPASAPAAQGGPRRLVSMWRLELGYRGSFVTNAGYNPFSTIDYFPQFSITASRTVFARGAFSFAPGIAWDYGKTGATARGDTTSLEVHRLVVPLEARFHLGRAGRYGYVFGRFAPGVAFEGAEVDDDSAPGPLTHSQWLLAGDASVGYAFAVVPRLDFQELGPRLWLQADGGYGWIDEQRLTLTASSPAGTPFADTIDLGTLGMRGAFMRFAVAVSL